LWVAIDAAAALVVDEVVVLSIELDWFCSDETSLSYTTST
jgi:hypothetical protein